jgi:hypothetical protein
LWTERNGIRQIRGKEKKQNQAVYLIMVQPFILIVSSLFLALRWWLKSCSLMSIPWANIEVVSWKILPLF